MTVKVTTYQPSEIMRNNEQVNETMNKLKILQSISGRKKWSSFLCYLNQICCMMLIVPSGQLDVLYVLRLVLMLVHESEQSFWLPTPDTWVGSYCKLPALALLALHSSLFTFLLSFNFLLVSHSSPKLLKELKNIYQKHLHNLPFMWQFFPLVQGDETLE